MRLAVATALTLALCPAAALADHHEEESRTEQFAQLPHWPGYWVSAEQVGTTIGGIAPSIIEARENGTPISNFMVLNGASAPWNEEGLRLRAEARARTAGRKAQGWGFPMMMNSATPVEYIITPEKVLIINAYNEARHVYMRDEMFDEMDLWPTVLGTSVGHWEGDTLVIRTVMVKTPNDYFHGAPNYSEDAVYVERIHMDGEQLINDFTVTDPATLSEPFHAQVVSVRDEGFDRMIQIDWDNDRTGVGEDGINTIEMEVVE